MGRYAVVIQSGVAFALAVGYYIYWTSSRPPLSDEEIIKEYVENYQVHPETVTFLQGRTGSRPAYEVGVDAARKAALILAAKYGGTIDFRGTEGEHVIPPTDKTDELPVTVYRPEGCGQDTSPPIVVYFHGGGNVTKSRKSHENVCRTLARDAPCVVVNVEYRLAPEHKFPANNDDAYQAVQWVAANKAKIGGSEDSRLGVAGDSAGGRLAAVVSQEATPLIDFAILVHPKVSYTRNYKSTEEFKHGPMLSKRLSDWFAEQYITDEEKNTPRASVIENTTFHHLPPTLIIVAEHDQLRDGCYDYYESLRAAGVNVGLKLIKGVPHTFWSLPGAFKTACAEAYTHATTFIKTYGNPRS